MTTFKDIDGVVYTTHVTQLGVQTVLVKEGPDHIASAYQAITDSLESIYQPVNFRLCEGVALEYDSELFYIKSISSRDGYTAVKVFGNEYEFLFPITKELVKFPRKYEDIVYKVPVQAEFTHLFDDAKTSKITIGWYEVEPVLLQSGYALKVPELSLIFKGKLIDSVGTKLTVLERNVYRVWSVSNNSDINMQLGLLYTALPNANVRLSSEGQMIISEPSLWECQPFILNRFEVYADSACLTLSSLANPTLEFRKDLGGTYEGN